MICEQNSDFILKIQRMCLKVSQTTRLMVSIFEVINYNTRLGSILKVYNTTFRYKFQYNISLKFYTLLDDTFNDKIFKNNEL